MKNVELEVFTSLKVEVDREVSRFRTRGPPEPISSNCETLMSLRVLDLGAKIGVNRAFTYPFRLQARMTLMEVTKQASQLWRAESQEQAN